MTSPALRCFMPGRMLLIVRNVAVRLPSTEACHPSSFVSSIGPGLAKLPPALATRSIGPSSSSMVAHGLDLGEPPEVGRNMDRTAACPLDFGSNGRQCLRIPSVYHHLCAPGGAAPHRCSFFTSLVASQSVGDRVEP